MNTNTPPTFNYKAPIDKGDGRYLIEPNFSSSEPLNKHLAIARNSEIPKLLTTKGALTEAENASMLYHHLKTNETVYLGTERNNRTTAGYLDPKSYHQKSPKAYAAAVKAQKMALQRDERRPGESKLEMILGGGRRANPRCYTLGFTVNPQALAAGSGPVNKAILANQAYVLEFLRSITEALIGPVETIVSTEELDLVARQREIDVPFTFGSAANYLFTSLQLNYSDLDQASLKNSLGSVGGLHADANDSPNHWTSLLCLSNMPSNYFGGRTAITSIRTYTEFPPKGKGVLVFRALHPHMSIGPAKMEEHSARKPLHFEMPEGDEELDPVRYIASRCMAVGYPKEHIMKKSPEIQRNLTPLLYNQRPNTKTNTPEKLPEALLAFGTKENQATWYAMAQAKNQARNFQNDSLFVPLTAAEIAHNHRYSLEDGSVATPDVSRIQNTLLGNSATAKDSMHHKNWEASDKFNRELLSQRFFRSTRKSGGASWTSKEGPIELVDESDIGSIIRRVELELAAKITENSKQLNLETSTQTQTQFEAAAREEFGKRPFKCGHCSSRFPAMKKCERHHIKKHARDYEWEAVKPSSDLKSLPKSESTIGNEDAEEAGREEEENNADDYMEEDVRNSEEENEDSDEESIHGGQK
ncbi:813c1d02-8d1a-4d9d-962f-d046a2cfa739 [Sclerotinia trifoliorum]|uniref:813c1d02-8d1a-4d9d-962f-d046a2cfa739 n=1 Tax=Sclerotinia trifoliorum TaxID=28548 RepID=A0A8H2VTI2_9HELO|nr:813c1d02-8d1a-4d9d-962f-d046a2cfa739 [Sclerotinia trifoliorum]